MTRQSDYRPDMAPARAVMRRVDEARISVPVPVKPTATPGTTLAERAHMARVAALGCLLCGQPAEVHHLREGQGMQQRASNWLTVPLCPDCHRGPRGIHGDRSALRVRKLEELDLLAMTIERMATPAGPDAGTRR